MFICRVQIKNFRNFKNIDVSLTKNVVLLGENRVGKTNFLFALRLVLDASLPDLARDLKLADIWDGFGDNFDDQIEIHVDFADFEVDPNLVALLTDFRLADNHQIARISYVWRKRADVQGAPKTSSDFEFLVFGGGDETRNIPTSVRRRIAIDTLDALRDAEAQLGSWRTSPIRPMLEDAIGKVNAADLTAVATDLSTANAKLTGFEPVRTLENQLRDIIKALSGTNHDIKAKLGFAPVDAVRVFRAVSMFIDEGKRSISEASLGSMNVVLLALKLAEFSWRREKNERNFTLLCVEEPEAHLHPQLQRSVFKKLYSPEEPGKGLIVTTHSPIIASVAKLRSIVLLRSTANGSFAYSLANLSVSPEELDDLQRYLTATRSELLFARGVIFVEGDAEEALMSVFAQSLGLDLDELGITVCNVAGTNFVPYVKLATALALPFSVITDWDPLDGANPPLGVQRTLSIYDAHRLVSGQPPLPSVERDQWKLSAPNDFRTGFAKAGIFLNEQTFEVSVATTAELLVPLLDVLDGQGFGAMRTKRLAAWRADAAAVDYDQLLSMVASVGKGRLSGKLALRLVGLQPPAYITQAIEYVRSRV